MTGVAELRRLLSRFALLDAQIADLTNSGDAEMVVGPVVFENFVLHHPGRFCNLVSSQFPILLSSYRFYMLRKASGVHNAMSEHYNV